METKTIEFKGSTIKAIGGHPADPEPTVVLTLTAPLTVAVADALKCRDMAYTVNDNARQFEGAFGLPLEIGENECEISFESPGFGKRTLKPFKVWKFRISHLTDLQLAVDFRAHLKGAADGQIIFDLLQDVNQDSFLLALASMQGELFPERTAATNDGTRVDMTPTEGLFAQKPEKPAKEKSGCKNCDAGIPFDDFEEGKHVNGDDCNIYEKMKVGQSPAVSAEPGQTPTAAEKKKARLAEEARKKELKTGAKGEWPEPNEHGVYEPSPEMTLEFFSKKCAAAIEYLQVGPHAWIAATSASYMDGSYGSPLTIHTIYPLKEVAIAKEAYVAAERAEKAAETASASGLKKQHQALREWFIEVFVKYSEGLEDGFMERDYRVAEEEPEPVEAAG